MIVKANSSEAVIQWVKSKIGRKGLVHVHLARDEDQFIYLPVHVRMKDAFKIAEYLQKIEDEWNHDKNHVDQPHLVLIPTKD